MSDGPYKTLPMKPRWRRVAKCAYEEVYSPEEVVETITRASHADWRAEIRSVLVTSATAIVAPAGQQVLFSDQMVSDLDSLRGTCESPMEAAFVGSLVDAVKCGQVGESAIQVAAEDALSDRLLCNYRQVEEHICREDSLGSAHFVRDRFETAHAQVDLSSLARAALRTGAPLPRRVRDSFTDIDAGVPR